MCHWDHLLYLVDLVYNNICRCDHIPIIIGTATVFTLTLAAHYFGLFSYIFHKVDPESTRYGGELVADVLKSHGVQFLFTLCGGHISPILTASEKRGIRVIDVRHEVTAVFAADAVARLSGTIGVAAVTAGPGLTNTITAVKNAQMAESPLLLLGGASARLLKGRGALQDIDQMSLFRPLCKYCASINYLREIVPTLKKAIQIAQSGTPGPVFVEFPVDTLYPYAIVRRELGIIEKPTSLHHRLLNLYLSNYLFQLYAGGLDLLRSPGEDGAVQNLAYRASLQPLPLTIAQPRRGEISRVADLLRRAHRPVMLLGSQALLPPVSAQQLASVVKEIGIPCFLGSMARGLLGKDSEIQMRHKRREALKDADLIILAGMVCDFRLSYGRVLGRKAKIVAINRDYTQLYKNHNLFWKSTVAIQADVGSTLVQLGAALQGYKPPQAWINTLKANDAKQEETIAARAAVPAAKHLNPLHVLRELDTYGLSDDSILVVDGGDFVGSAAYILRPRGPLGWLDPGAFGTLGVGGGFALGAKLCRPESDVWIIYGDGSLGYSVAEFDTFQRHKIPVLAVVGNDACWSQIAREQVPQFGSCVGCMLDYTSYDTVATGYGGRGFLLGLENVGKAREMFAEAVKITREEKKPVLLNCLIGKSDFREGSLAV